jgi:hypothetical protein
MSSPVRTGAVVRYAIAVGSIEEIRSSERRDIRVAALERLEGGPLNLDRDKLSDLPLPLVVLQPRDNGRVDAGTLG